MEENHINHTDYKQKKGINKKIPLIFLGGLMAISLLTVALVKQNQDIRQRAQVATTTFLETFDGAPTTPQPFSSNRWDITFDDVSHNNFGEVTDPIPDGTQNVQHGPDCGAPGSDGSITHSVSTLNGLVFNCRNHMMTFPPSGTSSTRLVPNHYIDMTAPVVKVRFDVSSLTMSSRDWISFFIQDWDVQQQRIQDHDIPGSQTNDSELDDPRNAIHVEQGGGDGGFFDSTSGRWHVENWDANRNLSVVAAPSCCSIYDAVTANAEVRTTIEFVYEQNGHVKVWLPNNGGFVLTEGNIPPVTWKKGVVTFIHWAYSPDKSENPVAGTGLGTGKPNTWHWDNIYLEPAVPFEIIKTDHRSSVDKGWGLETFNFAKPLPANSLLRFQAYGDGLRVKFDNDAWQNATRVSTYNHVESAASYIVANAPQGATSVTINVQNPGFGFVQSIQNVSAFSLSSGTSIPTSTPIINTPTPTIISSTPTRTPTPIPTGTAAQSDLSLSPATQTVTNGDTFPVQIRVNTNGQMVNAIQANITYPSNLLDIVSVSNSGGSFEVEAEKTLGVGTANLAYGTTTPKSGNLLVATITFSAKVAGSATVSFANSSAVVSSVSNSNVIRNKTGGTYTITNIVPTSTPTPLPGKTGDLNKDGSVNLTDLSILLSNWGSTNAVADINRDGTVGLTDLSMLLSNWGL